MIGPEGIEKLCVDLDVDPSDVSNSMIPEVASFGCKVILCIPQISIIFFKVQYTLDILDPEKSRNIALKEKIQIKLEI